MEIKEIDGTLNVADMLNVGAGANVRGNLLVEGDLRVRGVAYVSGKEAYGEDRGTGDTATTAEAIEELRSGLQNEATARRNADTTLENAIGVIRIDTAGAVNSARQATTKASEATETAATAAAAAETVRLRAERIGEEVRRDLEWWVFPSEGGTKAVETNGEDTIIFQKEGFQLRAGDRTYHIAPSLNAPLSITFGFGETGYVCLDIARLYRMMPD